MPIKANTIPVSDYGQAAEHIVNISSRLIYTFNNALKPHQITSQQFAILKILSHIHPATVTIKQIRSQMPDKMSDVSRIVEKMRSKGLIDRKINSEDRRNVDISITEKGLSAFSNTEPYLQTVDKQLEKLSSEEIQQLNVLLSKLNH
ncbi:MAG: MarR family winged helix-turn-helix transcriptional regulator [Bacteroidia bacterium]